jgi:predicted nucleic acid-binding protein|uniref:type II toxin-antitoxin system VapC family toxin n=1 Tax=Sphingomonas sp. TaxID=28214 RepID=UPI0025E3930D|nr:PIN domain nuclease [Sphingomonas sp.]
MILVDSSVWIDFLRDRETIHTDLLARIIKSGRLLTGDLVLTEVLQGIANEHAFENARFLLTAGPIITIADEAVAIQAARNYRNLRARGITIRKTIDTLIATRCIMNGYPLLYSDRDFDPFVEHLGLVSAAALPDV